MEHFLLHCNGYAQERLAIAPLLASASDDAGKVSMLLGGKAGDQAFAFLASAWAARCLALDEASAEVEVQRVAKAQLVDQPRITSFFQPAVVQVVPQPNPVVSSIPGSNRLAQPKSGQQPKRRNASRGPRSHPSHCPPSVRRRDSRTPAGDIPVARVDAASPSYSHSPSDTYSSSSPLPSANLNPFPLFGVGNVVHGYKANTE